MRFVDTNVFVRFLAGEDTRLAHVARDVFSSSIDENWFFTTNDSVIAEVIYVLTSSLYQLTRGQVADRLHTILQLPSCKIANLGVVVEALYVWQHQPRLSFVDALCLVTAQNQQWELVTFDTALAKVANVVRWDLRT